MTQIPKQMQELIASEVARGNFQSADDFISQMEKLFVDEPTLEAVRFAWLKASVDQADKEGGEVRLDDVCDRLEVKYQAMLD